MKARIAVLIIVIVALAGCGYYIWHEYDSADESSVPVGTVSVASRTIESWDNQYNIPVIGGLLHKEIVKNTLPAQYPVELGEVGILPYDLPISLADTLSYDVVISLHDEINSGQKQVGIMNDLITSADGSKYFPITKPGEYEISIIGNYINDENGGTTAKISYQASFSVAMPPPIYVPGRSELQQGDIYTIGLFNVPTGIVPTLETDLGPAVFAKIVPGAAGTEAETVEGVDNWYAQIPISNHRAVGEYTVTATAGEQIYEETVTVSEYDFDFQNMIIDTSVPSVAAAITGNAVAEFREKVGSLMPLISEEVYWDGYFEMPVDLGEKWFISTQFGEIRITNSDNSTRRSHYGMDFAVPTGTPVWAGNAGKVLIAESLLNTGNTVVIDHGGGLKSFYYHMSALHTETGAMVAKGDLIGEVGSEGYSTGPHLHYEIRIGEQAISPSMLFDPGAGLYSSMNN